MTIVESTRPVTGGVDTHSDVHVAAAVDTNGGVLGVESFATTPAGLSRSCIDWLAEFGAVDRVGVEGTGAYGAGLARHLRGRGLVVIEVDRPNRQERRRNGQVRRARRDRSGAGGVVGSCVGDREVRRRRRRSDPRACWSRSRSGRNARIKCLNQIRHLGFTAPDELRERLAGRAAPTAGAHRGGAASHRGQRHRRATRRSSRCATLGRRVLALDAEARRLDAALDTLVRRRRAEPARGLRRRDRHRRDLVGRRRRQPERIRKRSRVRAPVRRRAAAARRRARSTRHRLNPGGNRQANHALWRIVFTRMSSDERTRAYVARRLAEGRSKREIIRVLKRYVARELYPHLVRD